MRAAGGAAGAHLRAQTVWAALEGMALIGSAPSLSPPSRFSRTPSAPGCAAAGTWQERVRAQAARPPPGRWRCARAALLCRGSCWPVCPLALRCACACLGAATAARPLTIPNCAVHVRLPHRARRRLRQSRCSAGRRTRGATAAGRSQWWLRLQPAGRRAHPARQQRARRGATRGQPPRSQPLSGCSRGLRADSELASSRRRSGARWSGQRHSRRPRCLPLSLQARSLRSARCMSQAALRWRGLTLSTQPSGWRLAAWLACTRADRRVASTRITCTAQCTHRSRIWSGRPGAARRSRWLVRRRRGPHRHSHSQTGHPTPPPRNSKGGSRSGRPIHNHYSLALPLAHSRGCELYCSALSPQSKRPHG